MAAIEYNAKGGPLRPGDEHLGLSPNALRVLEKRYFLKDNEGKIVETPAKLFRRVAHNLAQADRLYDPAADVKATEEKFYELMAKLEFLPNSPTLMNAGAGADLSLSACFVLPVGDSLPEIFDALKWQALIHQAGGGTGFSFSRLRPAGDMVKSTQGVASGPVSFMKIFDAATQTVKQGGCISAASLLRTSEGMKPLGALLNTPPLGENFTRDLVFDGSHYSHALVAQDNGPTEVYSIETELGLTLQATYNHAVSVVDEEGYVRWREASQLRPGHWLVVVKGGHLGVDKPLPPLPPQHFNASPLRVPERMNPELAEFLGLYMADGCTSSGGRLILTVGTLDIEVAERVKILAERCFGLRPNLIREGNGGGYIDVQFQSRGLVRWMERLGWVKDGSPKAFVPREVMAASAESARAFLRGLFEGDGHVHAEYGYPCFTSTSKRMVEEAQQLLLSLGVVARRRITRNRRGAWGTLPLHTLAIVDEDSVRRFCKDIGFIGDRKNACLENRRRAEVNTSDVIPNQGPVLRSLYPYVGRGSGPGRSKRGARRELYRALMHYVSENHRRALPRKQLQRLMERFSEVAANEHLRAMVDPARVYTQVAAVRKDRALTADLEVPGPASFVANGILVHNKRRGANMGILRVDHPDVEEFMTCKEDVYEITNFNISVAITDEFMDAVKKGEKYGLINPRTGKVVKQLDARTVFDKIATQAWKNGEPGLFFIDITNHTNPCVAGDTLVATDRGLIPVKDLFKEWGMKPIGVATDDRTIGGKAGMTYRDATGIYKTGIKTIWKLRTASGLELRATYDHQVFTPKGWVPLGLLRKGDLVVIQPLATTASRAAPVPEAPVEAIPLAADGGRATAVFEDEVVAVEKWGKDVVYDITEPITHSFIANGIVVHNCPNIGEFEATNPCGEQPLLAFESCNLGSIVLEKHMKRVGNRWEMDWDHLEASVRSCVHFLDNIIDMNNFPIPQIEELTKATRKIGLGVMGFARVLFKLGVAYDSPEGVEWGRRLMGFIDAKAIDESQRLAEKRGVYPAWKGSMHEKMGLRMRNSYVTTVAPTGTICMIADTSGGCEPEFSLIWYKNVMDGDHLPYMLEYFLEVARKEGFWSEDLVEKIIANHGSCRGLKEVPERWQRAFATSHDISPEWHVRMQAAYQENCSAAISKTCNLPNEATMEDVKKAYLLAYELGCKGITVYRDGSRPEQVLNVGVDTKKVEAKVPEEKKGTVVEVKVPPVIKPRPRPDELWGRTQKIRTGYGTLYVTINQDEYGLFEVFAQIGRGGGYTASFTEAAARLISLCLRSGIPVEEVVAQLEGIRSPRVSWDHQEAVFSIPDALAKALKRHTQGTVQKKLPTVEAFDEKPAKVRTDDEAEREWRDDSEDVVRAGLNPECPECGNPVVFEEGCIRCVRCGYSEC